MDKRYQVFVSSTFKDLEDERQGIMRTLMELDCIPAGMELFPAVDEEQWAFIQKVIDDCDYYLLIIGGRYGSLTREGLSFTEKEYDYAVSKGIHVIALLHKSPDQLSVAKSERDKSARRKLEAFRKKVSSNRLVKEWDSFAGLVQQVTLSLTRAIKAYPRLGWVRGGSASNPQLLEQINELRQQNASLEKQIASLNARSLLPEGANLASGKSHFRVSGSFKDDYSLEDREFSDSLSWNEIIGCVGPSLMAPITDADARTAFANALLDSFGFCNKQGARLDQSVFDTIKVQLMALGYIESNTAGSWSLTDTGRRAVFALRAITDSCK